jgi:hypothetical protein
MAISRRDAIAAIPSSVVVAVAATEASAQVTNPDPAEFVVHSGCGGFGVVKNGPDDYTLRMFSADGRSSLKYLRLKGPGALTELSNIYRTLNFVSEKFGVPID